jgi:hypothetical protein
MTERRLIARVTAGDPPPGLNLLEWCIWRALEDRRMAAELQEQIEAFYELLAGATLH